MSVTASLLSSGDAEGAPVTAEDITWTERAGVEVAGWVAIDEEYGTAGPLTNKVLRRMADTIEYENDLVERQLRAIIQHHSQLACFFMGSRKHLIKHMFLHKSRPLYRSAGHYPLLPITVEKWKPFIQRRFQRYNKFIDARIIEKLCRLTKGRPFYTQHLSHVLLDVIINIAHSIRSLLLRIIVIIG